MDRKIKIGLLIFALFSLVYFLSVRGNIEISDTGFSVQTAKSIVTKHSLSIQECRGGYSYKSEKDAKCYSKFGLGLALIFTPYVLLGKIVATLSSLPEAQTINFLISFYNIFFGAGACVVMFYIIKFFGGSDRISLNMALLLGLGTFCWRYSIWDFSEAAQMFFLALSIYCVLRNSIKSLSWGAFSLCCLLLLKAIYIIYIPIFIIYILTKNRQDAKDTLTRAGMFLLIILAGFSLILLLNYIRFGEFFEFGYGLEAREFYFLGIQEHVKKLLYWLDKGVFIYNPLFILGILGYCKLFKLFQKEAIFFLSIITFHLLLTSMWYSWHGDWSWGPRYLVPTAPLWLVPCFLFFNKKGIVKIVLILFIFVSLSIQIVSILQGNLEYLTICNTHNQEGFKKGMPAQIIGAAITLKHKLIKNDNVYSLSEFGVNSNTQIDVSQAGYRGFDFWYLHLARHFNKPWLKYLPLLFLPFIAILFIRLFKITAI
ncbi:MAG: hypothetical protein WCY09_01760 [Candidatus Omnitrophota bacterium]